MFTEHSFNWPTVDHCNFDAFIAYEVGHNIKKNVSEIFYLQVRVSISAKMLVPWNVRNTSSYQ